MLIWIDSAQLRKIIASPDVMSVSIGPADAVFVRNPAARTGSLAKRMRARAQRPGGVGVKVALNVDDGMPNLFDGKPVAQADQTRSQQVLCQKIEAVADGVQKRTGGLYLCISSFTPEMELTVNAAQFDKLIHDPDVVTVTLQDSPTLDAVLPAPLRSTKPPHKKNPTRHLH